MPPLIKLFLAIEQKAVIYPISVMPYIPSKYLCMEKTSFEIRMCIVYLCIYQIYVAHLTRSGSGQRTAMLNFIYYHSYVFWLQLHCTVLYS